MILCLLYLYVWPCFNCNVQKLSLTNLNKLSKLPTNNTQTGYPLLSATPHLPTAGLNTILTRPNQQLTLKLKLVPSQHFRFSMGRDQLVEYLELIKLHWQMIILLINKLSLWRILLMVWDKSVSTVCLVY